jgi:hypothetical protein
MGDWVFYPPELHNKFGRVWKSPYLVTRRLRDVNYVVQKNPTDRKITLHIDHMKVYTHDDVPESWIVPTLQNASTAVQADD